MIYLLYSILINTLLFVIFKYFEKYEIDNFQAIVVNYFVAFLIGITISNVDFNVVAIPQKPWFYGALTLGVIFIVVFNILALTAQKVGLSAVSVASKMSLVIPVLVGYFFLKETITSYKFIGICIALLAVYFVSQKANMKAKSNKYLHLPIALFFGSGCLDAILNFIKTKFVTSNEDAIYSATIFLAAGFVGIVAICIQLFRGKIRLKPKNVLAGILLGVPNYFSIYFLIKALHSQTITSATIFTINNVAIVLMSTIIGIILFKEQLIKKNYVGILLAIIAILLMI